MIDSTKVRIQFVPTIDSPPDQELTRRLSKDIVDCGFGDVSFDHEVAVGDAKSGTGLIEWITVALAAGNLLHDLLRLAMDWAQRARNPVRVRIGNDEIEIASATDEQQEELVKAFVVKHGAR